MAYLGGRVCLHRHTQRRVWAWCVQACSCRMSARHDAHKTNRKRGFRWSHVLHSRHLRCESVGTAKERWLLFANGGQARGGTYTLKKPTKPSNATTCLLPQPGDAPGDPMVEQTLRHRRRRAGQSVPEPIANPNRPLQAPCTKLLVLGGNYTNHCTSHCTDGRPITLVTGCMGRAGRTRTGCICTGWVLLAKLENAALSVHTDGRSPHCQVDKVTECTDGQLH
jgi:hypothetical protein